MRQIVLDNTGLALSRLGLGTAALLQAGGAAARARYLSAALDVGFTHFDTAPLYGFGAAERDLGGLAAVLRDCTITTKVGLYPPGGADQNAASAIARKAGGRIAPVLSRAIVDWRVDRARRALDGSLRRLRRSHIDLYLIHEPCPAQMALDEWRRWLEDERAGGRLRAIGVAGSIDHVRDFIAEPAGVGQVIQVGDSLETREADELGTRPLQLTYGYVRAARTGGQAIDAAGVLRAALARNAQGTIIVASRRVAHLTELAALA